MRRGLIVDENMKKSLLWLVCFLPTILLGVFYVGRLGFQMRDASMFGILLIVIGAVLSALIPSILFLTQLFTKPKCKQPTWFILSCLSSAVFWLVNYMDFGKVLHRFIAA